MENNIVDELNEKYGISKFIINLMLRDTLDKGYNMEEAKKIMCDFFEERHLTNKP